MHACLAPRRPHDGKHDRRARRQPDDRLAYRLLQSLPFGVQTRLFPQVVPPVFTDAKTSLRYWLKREYLVRAVYAGAIDAARLRTALRSLETQFIEEEAELFTADPDEEALMAFSLECHRQEEELINSFRAEEALRAASKQLPGLWRRYTARLGLSVLLGTWLNGNAVTGKKYKRGAP